MLTTVQTPTHPHAHTCFLEGDEVSDETLPRRFLEETHVVSGQPHGAPVLTAYCNHPDVFTVRGGKSIHATVLWGCND